MRNGFSLRSFPSLLQTNPTSACGVGRLHNLLKLPIGYRDERTRAIAMLGQVLGYTIPNLLQRDCLRGPL